MKRHTSWISAFLMLIGLLGLSSISLAQEGKWTKKADMPTARMAFSTSVVNGKIYAIGGVTGLKKGSDVISTVEEYDPLTDTWTKKADMPTKRRGLSTSVVNGKIYAIGGSADPGAVLSTVEEYDHLTDTWTKKANMPTARALLSTSVVNEKIYAIGGWKTWGIEFSTVEEYDPVMDKWIKKANVMPTARMAFSTSVVNKKIYAIGGVSGGGVVPSRILHSVEEYDPLTDTWTKKGNMPIGKSSVYTTVVNGKIYAIGVIGGLLTVEEYDPIKDKWTIKDEMGGIGRWSFETIELNGKIYAIGGVAVWDIFSTVEEYDLRLALGIKAKGKLATSWGKVKAAY